MRRMCAAFAACIIAPQAYAQSFQPEPEEVCVASAGTTSRIDPDALLWELFRANSISPRDLGVAGEVPYSLRYAAVVNPESFCKAHPCREGAEDALTKAKLQLANFWNRHSASAPSRPRAFETGPFLDHTNARSILTAFFQRQPTVKAICIARAQPEPKLTAPALPPVVRDVRIRRNPTDLIHDRGSDGFQAIDRASLSISRDYVERSTSYALDGVVGYRIGPIFDEQNRIYADLIPFASYTRQYVTGSASPDSNVNNIGAGLISHFIFPIFGYYQDIQAFPKLVHSERSGVSILSGNLVVTPDFPLPGMGRPEPLGEWFSFMLKPQAKATYASLVNAGDGSFVREEVDKFRYGPRVEFWLGAVAGPFQGLSVNASYEYLWNATSGPFSFVNRFEGAIAYTIPKQEYWSIELRYVDGRNLDTFERQRQLTLGVGLKY